VQAEPGVEWIFESKGPTDGRADPRTNDFFIRGPTCWPPAISVSTVRR